ncbi:PREDICTED: BRCA1-associated RING domain protein 1 [Ipomoea nil]|uniref:BRCA1-associated RING domain protein 1 n=1 Tax=Ipomoea nil TaxID=35883 RepID=UPI0009015A1B|nr:PREDICTED: BRCA1-associated RING domain protein 1 [Ipomoea nil]
MVNSGSSLKKKSVMADSQSIARFLNPWTLHLQKLGLELKCPLCLKLLNKPVLLPCNHLFCNFCVPDSTQCGSECPVCKHQFSDRDIRPAPYIENMVSIYQSLDAAFVANVSLSLSSAVGRSLEQSPVSVSSAQGTSSKEMRSDKAVMSNLCLNKGLMQRDGRIIVLNGKNGSDPLPTSVLAGNMTDGRPLAEEIDVNQLPQQSPVSYLSSDDNKDVDGNTCELACRDLGFGKTAVNISDVDGRDMTTSEICCRSRDDDASLERDTKRQKKLNYRLSEMDSQIGGNTRKEIASECNMEHIAGSSLDVKAICAFCKSSNTTEVTGPMLFYANGKEVVDTFPDATPAHRLCIDWAPQVYYDGEIIKNFKSELARSAKLKCNICGLKGAALGCYMKSCQRTYHMPCAFGIQECRWDLDNFLMLCPSHKSVRFPNEKLKSQKCSTVEKKKSAKLATEQFNFWATSPDGPKQWVLCGSALSQEDKYTLVKFAKMCGATVSKLWTPNVTHVLASTDAEGACTRTLKVLMAILGGKWILSMDWVRTCMDFNGPMNEEPYEITLDNHGCSDGPKTGRLRASTNAPKLFVGLKFYISGDFLAPYLKDLLQLVEVAGGTIVENKEQLIAETRDLAPTDPPYCVIVYNCDPPRGCMPAEESSILLRRFAEADEIAKQIGCLAIKHTWILESIAGCKLVPFMC